MTIVAPETESRTERIEDVREFVELIEVLPRLLRRLDRSDKCPACVGTGYEYPSVEEQVKLVRATVDALVRAARVARRNEKL